MRRSALLLAAILSLASPAWAQSASAKAPADTTNQRKDHPAPGNSQPRKWWLDERYRSSLNLSADQVRRIDRIFEDHSAVQRQLWMSLQEAEREVSKLMADAAPEEARAVAAIERAELLRYKLNERRALCLFRIRQQLTHEQHLKFVRLHEAGRPEKHGGSPK